MNLKEDLYKVGFWLWITAAVITLPEAAVRTIHALRVPDLHLAALYTLALLLGAIAAALVAVFRLRTERTRFLLMLVLVGAAELFIQIGRPSWWSWAGRLTRS